MNTLKIMTAIMLLHVINSKAEDQFTSDHLIKKTTEPNFAQLWDLDITGVANSVQGDRLGETLAAGDFNGDGHIDLAIGIPNRDFILSDVGSVLIIYGNFLSLDATNSVQLFSGAVATGDRFGSSLTVGDYNQDGFADLVVGSPTKDFINQANITFENTGAINIFYGAANGLPLTSELIDADANDEIGTDRQAFAEYGQALTSGDFNQDGYDDLVVGAPKQTVNGLTNAGTVFIYYGGQIQSGNMGLFSESRDLINQATAGIIGASEENDFFGTSLTTGDFNNNGFDDLAIGVPFEAINTISLAGLVQVIYGSINGIQADDEIWQQSNISGESTETGDLFGFSLASGDINGDGHDDLLIGAPLEDLEPIDDAGVAHFLPGSTMGLNATGSLTFHQDTPGIFGVPEASDRFGISLTTADLDVDGFDEAIIGVPFESFDNNNESGFIHMIPGIPAGLEFTDSTYIGGNNAGDDFGWSFSQTENYFGPSLIIAIPGIQSSDNDLDAGAVLELFYSNPDIILKDGFDFSGGK